MLINEKKISPPPKNKFFSEIIKRHENIASQMLVLSKLKKIR